mgnify:CR=1 FL=1
MQALFNRWQGLQFKHVAIDHWAHWKVISGAQSPLFFEDLIAHKRGQCPGQRGQRHLSECLARGRNTQHTGQGMADALCVLQAVALHAGALQNDALEQGLTAGQAHQVGDGAGACRDTRHGHTAWVAAKQANVLLYPSQRRQLVLQPPVGRSIVKVHEAINANAVVDRHKNNALAGHGAAVVQGVGRATPHETTTGNPDHHRPRTISCGRAPHIQTQAVQIACMVSTARQTGLCGHGAKTITWANSHPWRDRLWCLPTTFTNGC